jgi:hypothetical protein
MSNERDREVCGEEFHNAVFLSKELHEVLMAWVVFLHDSIGLVLRHRLMAMHRPAFEGEVNAVGLELIDECPELTKEVVNDSVLAGGKSAASTMGDVHKVDAEDGHETIRS